MCARRRTAEDAKKPCQSPRRELSMPKLSRRIVPNARVNLNDFWEAFEGETFDVDLARIGRRSSYSTYRDNEINDNLINEILELGKLALSTGFWWYWKWYLCWNEPGIE